MTIFVSYARTDRTAVEALRGDLSRTSRVWLDEELAGGQEWWDTILENIRSCQLLVFALSPDSVRSKACQAELEYAVALGRPLLPVMIKPVAVQLAPRVIADRQFIDYTERTADSRVALVAAAATQRPAPPIPDPLPEPPAPPLTYMKIYRDQIEATNLPYLEQAQLVLILRGHLQDEDERAVAEQLLGELRRRPDITESVARDIDTLVASTPDRLPSVDSPGPAGSPTPERVPHSSNPSPAQGPGPASSTTPAKPAEPSRPEPTAQGPRTFSPDWYPDPTRRYERRYYDGTRWTDHVVAGGRTFVDALDRPVIPETVDRGNQGSAVPPSGSAAPFSGGAFVGLIIATVFVGLVGVIVGAINLKEPARRGQAQALLWLGIASMVLGWIIFFIPYS